MSTTEAGGGGRLAPCPMCGASAELEQGSDHHGPWFNLGCSNHFGRVGSDLACIMGRIFYTGCEKPLEEAIATWNRRSLPAAAQALREAGWAVVEPGVPVPRAKTVELPKIIQGQLWRPRSPGRRFLSREVFHVSRDEVSFCVSNAPDAVFHSTPRAFRAWARRTDARPVEAAP